MDAYYPAAVQDYVTTLYRATDDRFALALEAMETHDLPRISVGADEGRFLALMTAAVGARKALEIGTLAGYSGLWIASALPTGGQLVTLEADPRHADVARGVFAAAGMAERVRVVEGAALDVLPTLQAEAPFDAVFIDADKDGYPAYLDWALRLTRPGAVIMAHNAYLGGDIASDDGTQRVRAVRAFNTTLATDSRFVSTLVPLRDGMAVAIVGRPEGGRTS